MIWGPTAFIKLGGSSVLFIIGPKKNMAVYTHPILTLKNPMKTLWCFIAAWTQFLTGAIWNDLGQHNFYQIW